MGYKGSYGRSVSTADVNEVVELRTHGMITEENFRDFFDNDVLREITFDGSVTEVTIPLTRPLKTTPKFKNTEGITLYPIYQEYDDRLEVVANIPLVGTLYIL